MNIIKQYKDRTIRIRRDRYVSLTDMAQVTNKLFADWNRLKSTKSYLEVLSAIMGIPIIELVQTQVGGSSETTGTWGHPKVAIRFAQWCSDEFAVQVDIWVDELLTVGHVDLQSSNPTSQPSSLDALVQSLPALAQLTQSMADMERRLLEQEKSITQLVAEKSFLKVRHQWQDRAYSELRAGNLSLERRQQEQEKAITRLAKGKATSNSVTNLTSLLLENYRETWALKRELATQDTQVQQHEQILSQLNREKEEASRRLEELPPPTVEAPPLTVRQSVRRLVNDFSAKTGTGQSEVWQRLYQELYYRCKINLSRRAKRKNQSRLDVIEEMGLLDNLYAIASEVLV